MQLVRVSRLKDMFDPLNCRHRWYYMEASTQSDIRSVNYLWGCLPPLWISRVFADIGNDMPTRRVPGNIDDFSLQVDPLLEVEVLRVSPQIINIFLDTF